MRQRNKLQIITIIIIFLVCLCLYSIISLSRRYGTKECSPYSTIDDAIEDGSQSYKMDSSAIEKSNNNTVIKGILPIEECALLTDIPWWSIQGGCYVEDGLFLFACASSFGDYTILRCYDINSDSIIWEKMLSGCGHANSICFRPIDRRLYVANCTVYGSADWDNRISVIDYDNIEEGVIQIINTQADGIYSIAYDRDNDRFYGWNCIEGEADNTEYILVSYDDLFKSIREEIWLDTSWQDSNVVYSSQGFQCVVDGIGYILYYEPSQIIAGYDLTTGEVKYICEVPVKIGQDEVHELESFTFSQDTGKFYVSSFTDMYECPAVNLHAPGSGQLKLITKLPQIWALMGCYVENGKYIIGYVSTLGEPLILRCYNSIFNSWEWVKIIDECTYANSICFRPSDRKLYISNSYTYADEGRLANTISVLNYDDIDNGIADIITSPARGKIYSIAYDRDSDTFYSTNFLGSTENDSNALFSYNGVFNSVKSEILLDDFTVRNDTIYSSLGVSCVNKGIAYFVYYSPSKFIAGFDIETGECAGVYELPLKTQDDFMIGEPQTLIYNPDDDHYILQTATNLIRVNPIYCKSKPIF